MAINLSALRALKEEITKPTGDGKLLFINKLADGEQIEVRLTPWHESQRDKPFVEVAQYFLTIPNGKETKKVILTLPLVDGRLDPVAAIVEEARKSGDETLLELLSDYKSFSYKHSHVYAVYQVTDTVMEEDENGADRVTSVQVDKDLRMISVPQGVSREILEILTNAKFMKHAPEWGVADFAKGRNLLIGRTGAKLETKYSVTAGDRCPLPSELRERFDVVEYFNTKGNSDRYAVAAINAFLYGDELPEKDFWRGGGREEEQVKEEKATAKTAKSLEKSSTTAKRYSLIEDVEDDD